MNNFLEVFNDELKKVQTEERDDGSQVQHDDNYLEEIERDLGKISEIYEPVIEVIKQKFDDTAEIKSTKNYKAGEEKTINYKGSTAISYQMQKNNVYANLTAA